MYALRFMKITCLRQSFFKTRRIAGFPVLFLDKQPFLHFEKRTSSGRNGVSVKSQVIKKNVDQDSYKLSCSPSKQSQVIERENIWTIPNILCCTRIACSPYLAVLIYGGQFNLAFYVMILVGLTDVLDGFIARTFTSQSTKFGTFLDPLADKILITTTCIALASANLIPIPLTILILSRDVALVSAGFYIRYKSLPPPKTLARYFDASHATAKLEPTKISKFNSLVQLATVGVGLMSPVAGFTGHPFLEYLWYFTASTTIASGVSYIFEIDKYKFNYDDRKHRKEENEY